MGFFDFIYKDGVPFVRVNEAREKQQAGVPLIDIREIYEWNKGHADGAVHIPMGKLVLHMGTLGQDAEVMLMCGTGQRALEATRRLHSAGFTNVVHVHGGLHSWKGAGYPVVRR